MGRAIVPFERKLEFGDVLRPTDDEEVAMRLRRFPGTMTLAVCAVAFSVSTVMGAAAFAAEPPPPDVAATASQSGEARADAEQSAGAPQSGNTEAEQSGGASDDASPLATTDAEETAGVASPRALTRGSSVSVDSIGLTWLVRDEDIAVGAAVAPLSPRLQFRWQQYDVAAKKWGSISDWSAGNWASWRSTPGVYWLHLEVRDSATGETVGTKTIPFRYSAGTTRITGTYAGWKDGGVLLGVASSNPRARYAVKIYSVDRKQWVVGFSGQWAMWRPSKGTYWTHFEAYTSDGRLADTRTYAFGVGLKGYTAPAGYLDVTDRITPLNGRTNTLTPGFNGVKVRIVQQKLGVWYSSKLATMDAATVQAVKTFQRRAGLSQDGVVGVATWNGLNTGWGWDIDTYQAQPIGLTATRNERIEKMIDYAWRQSGSDYVWGGAGSYYLGYDCSGLVLQSLYAAGLDPQPIDVLVHAYPSYRTSQELYKHPWLMHVPVGQRQRGDIVFYVDSSGTVYHTGIYIGSDQIIHTDWMGRPARQDTVYQGTLAPTVVRPFP